MIILIRIVMIRNSKKKMEEEFWDEEAAIALLFAEVEEATDFEQLSILKMMEKMVQWADDNRLTERFFECVAEKAKIMGDKLNLTPEEAVMLSIFIANYNDSTIEINDIQKHTKASMIRLAQLQDVVDSLERHRYIQRSRRMGSSEYCYFVPKDCLKAIRSNTAYVHRKFEGLSINMFLSELSKIIGERYRNQLPVDILVEDISALVDSNLHLKASNELKKLDKILDESDWILVAALMAAEYEDPSDPTIELDSIGRICDERMYRFIRSELENGTSDLIGKGIVELGNSDGMVDSEAFRLTRKAKKTLLSELKVKHNCSSNKLKRSKDIIAKALHYDADVREQVTGLEDMLTDKKFKAICSRMEKRGMRKGFACLFYGAAGTGKTETVLQLAKKTGRNIMQVDFSTIKDKYVGESEKNVKAIFSEYRELAESEKLCPILLFNEADALIGKRFEDVRHSVDKMENSIQNILLQELETFEGIMIATTNLEGNLDSAFERRFLYKVRFEKPSPEVRKLIWRSHIPELTDEAAGQLAKDHDFSGGQIENIARKSVVDEILYGETDDLYALIKGYCDKELIQNRKAGKSVGFCA